MTSIRKSHGFTLIEVLIVVAISGMLMVSLSNIVGGALSANEVTQSQNDLHREASFIMDRIIAVVSHSPDVTVMDVPGMGAVNLLISARLDPDRDTDMNGIPDADNDADGEIDEGPISEDWEDWVRFNVAPSTQRLIEEDPYPIDVNGTTGVDALDKRYYTMADNVTGFSGLLKQDPSTRFDLLVVNLELTGKDGETVTRSVKIRVGGAL